MVNVNVDWSMSMWIVDGQCGLLMENVKMDWSMYVDWSMVDGQCDGQCQWSMVNINGECKCGLLMVDGQ